VKIRKDFQGVARAKQESHIVKIRQDFQDVVHAKQ
jgi:hypothetical protein